MPTKNYFEEIPAFPSNIETAELPRIRLGRLLSGQKTESDALFEASRKLGFFLLDFEGCTEGESFLRQAETMFKLNKEVNDMDVDELMKYAYHPPHSLFG